MRIPFCKPEEALIRRAGDTATDPKVKAGVVRFLKEAARGDHGPTSADFNRADVEAVVRALADGLAAGEFGAGVLHAVTRLIVQFRARLGNKPEPMDGV